MTNKERYLELCSKVKREGIEDLVKWLEASDFFYAPASTRFHGSYAGGLLEHSLNVYDELVRLLAAYPEVQASEESAIIVSLFHDLCKVNMYGVEKRNRIPAKPDGETEAKIIALACSEPPKGYSRWSIRLLRDKSVELHIVDDVSRMTIQRLLKKRNINLI